MVNKFSSGGKLKRSPIKAPPLHSAGQSLDEEIHRIQNEEIGTYIAVSGCMFFMSIYEWYQWIASAPPAPLLMSLVAVIIIAYCVIKIIKFKKEVKKLKLARDGEKAVGEYLDLFRERGYRVLHDLVVGDFNIDHIMIGETGIYTIETKTISKYKRGIQKIHYDGNEISINGFKPNRNPVVQAKAQAAWIKDFIQDFHKKDVQIKPVVVFHRWYVEGTIKAEVWVLEPKALKKLMEHRKNLLDEKDIPIIASNLTRYLRTREEFSRNHK